MQQYSDEPPPDALRQAQTDLGNVKDIMVNNIDQILSRGERIELLVDKTDQLSGQAWAFKRGAKGVRRKMWWKVCPSFSLCIGRSMLMPWAAVARQNAKITALCGVVGLVRPSLRLVSSIWQRLPLTRSHSCAASDSSLALCRAVLWP